MSDVTYSELVLLCGKRMAYPTLRVIERAAKVKEESNVVHLDFEKRLRCAFEIMRENELTA